jgi:hypothetical protein
MKVTKYSFFLVMLVYLGFQAFVHLTDNTTATGVWSQIYLGWCAADIILLAMTFNHLQQTARGRILTHADAKKVDEDDTIDLDIGKFGFQDYMYYLIMVAYLGFNASQHLHGNTINTGAVSIWYAIWTLLDVYLAYVAVQQLYLILVGKEVKLVSTKKAA